jgi:predicted nucleic acid-binding protein
VADSLLLDTNILVYSVEDVGDFRSAVASSFVSATVSLGLLVTTAQIMTEFYAVTTRARRRSPALTLTRRKALAQIEEWMGVMRFLPATADTTRHAIRLATERQMHVYDAQICAVARHYDVRYIITEDLPAERVVEGVRYVDPFDPSFDYAQIGL